MNLFISYVWKDGDSVHGFKGSLGNPNNDLKYNDMSVKHDFSEYGNQAIKDGILDKIRQADMTVCLISQRSEHSKWVNWELEQSRLLGKPIVGIIYNEQPLTPAKAMPEFFNRYPQYQVHSWGTPQALNEAIQRALISGRLV